MNSEFVGREVGKILKDDSFEFPKNLAMAAAWIMGNLKGVNLKVLDMREKSSLADFYVIGSATNVTQASAMADTIIRQFRKHGHKPVTAEGLGNADWILLDMGDIIVHVLLETARSAYDLEGLWKDATPVEIPHQYYVSSGDENEAGGQGDSGREFF